MQLNFNEVQTIFSRFEKINKNPVGELYHFSAFTLLIAVVLSAQATDISVNKATKLLFKNISTPSDIIQMGESKLITYVKSIGLYKNKARNIVKLSEILISRYAGIVPSSRSALQSLPGVGRKTANVVLNIWFGLSSQAVDTHIFRVGNRTGIAAGKDVLLVERAIEDNIPAEFQKNAHNWLILHGRYTCKSRKPSCKTCCILDLCNFKEKYFGQKI